MDAEIIAVGSELLSYNRTDTNSLWLTGKLNDLGVEVRQKAVVNDDRARLAESVRQALQRSQFVFLSGGLGPTEDDLTREAVADALGRKLVLSSELTRWLEERFARLNRKMAEVNRRQAYLIEGAEPLPNPNGTAAGQWIEAAGKVVVLLPGPPRELYPMAENHVLPRLRAMLPPAYIRTRWLRVAGIGESDLDQMIAPVYREYDNPVTTILAKAGDIEIHLRARCETPEEAERLVDELEARLDPLLGTRLYSRNGDPLEKVVGEMLAAREATVAVAESCTGGLLGARITDVPGSSRYFVGGMQVYGASMKTQLLGLDPGLLEKHGLVSEAVAVAMAESVRDRTRATYALSVTGEAGPVPADSSIQPGVVWIGLATPHKVEAKRFGFPGDRGRIRSFAVQTALNLLRLELMK